MRELSEKGINMAISKPHSLTEFVYHDIFVFDVSVHNLMPGQGHHNVDYLFHNVPHRTLVHTSNPVRQLKQIIAIYVFDHFFRVFYDENTLAEIKNGKTRA